MSSKHCTQGSSRDSGGSECEMKSDLKGHSGAPNGSHYRNLSHSVYVCVCVCTYLCIVIYHI